MLDRYADCPVCGNKTVLRIPENIIEDADRFPFTVKVIHKDHHFYVNLDSRGWVTDILHPEMVEG
ncbi:hypothetical protein EU545_01395 [Candidatus Thorarchaeota archaeon]|nr:MAG: hypothetical protein EU545_01395 [Candidatus Thorarchaeota archaeon]